MRKMNIWLLVIITGLCMVSKTKAKGQVPCFFIFGDSLSDNGNNNGLSTLARVNYKPYGIDFPAGPTGRFTNGRTTTDILGQLLGFENYIPSYVTARATGNILDGVNYASGSAGILTETGKHMGDNIDFGTQVLNHQMTVLRMMLKLGGKAKADQYLNKCLYYVGLGSNDYINNYFNPDKYRSSKLFTPEQFAARLIQQYRFRIMQLYILGARKVALSGIGRIGCTPNSISSHGTEGSSCVEFMNEAVQFFNVKLLIMVDQLNANLADAKFIYINSYGMGDGNPAAAGFKVWDRPCCPVNNVGQCVPDGTPCGNRREYVFWDAHHPMEFVNVITANRIYNSNDLSDCYPLDVGQLVQWAPQSMGL